MTTRTTSLVNDSSPFTYLANTPSGDGDPSKTEEEIGHKDIQHARQDESCDTLQDQAQDEGQDVDEDGADYNRHVLV
nr:hypothetical protein BaRGS_030853 [Batillaria attramentaria]